MWSATAPSIVAEALTPVDPVLTSLRPGPWSGPASVARALARSLLTDEEPDPPPPWRLPGEGQCFHRVLAALRRHHGAILADPVGSGKTYVALAAAAALNPGGPTACLVPATLCDQWQAVAAGLGLPVVVVSHQQLSRGHLPKGTRGLVVIDESHHFRNPGTRRYRHVAPWLAGRATLMVTATPIVNRLDDLAHQLLIGVRDDALLGDGVASLRSLLAGGCGSPALGRLVIENPAIAVTRPERTAWTSRPEGRECAAAAEAIEIVTPLRLSARRSVAALVRAVLRRAASSSPAALVAALERYRLLLLHSRDASRAGRRLERGEIRRFAGELEEQLVWWELLPAEQEAIEPELDLSDLEAIEAVLHRARGLVEAADPKLNRLRALLADKLPTLVFVARRETVRYLRDRIGGSTIAWCTGERAGLGRSRVPRATVLEWFGDGAGAEIAERIGVRHLVVTDVAAEGLDLQRAARVIHYDLPWTQMGLEQREGRAVRLGSRHRSVEVVRFAPPPVMEHALHIEGAIARKSGLPGIAGLGVTGRRLWRWRSELGEALGEGERVAGVAIAASGPEGVLAGVSFHAFTARQEVRLASLLIWIAADGRWTEEEDVVGTRLQAARHATPGQPDAGRLRQGLEMLAEPVRARLALARARRWASPETAPSAHRVAARLQLAVRGAARRRDVEGLVRLERALGFVGGGHTAGETALLDRLAGLSDAELLRATAGLPAPSPRWDAIEARLTGIVLFAKSE